MFYRIGKPEKVEADFEKFEDGDKIQNWAIDAFKWAVKNEIIGGTSDDGGETLYLNPQGLATRAEASTLFIVWMNLARD